MNPSIRFSNLNKKDDIQFELFFKVYADSIERSEQKKKNQIRELIQRDDYLIRLIFKNNSLVGFTCTYCNYENKFALLEYMAIEESQRSFGYGSELLRDLNLTLKTKKIDWLVLEVDSPFQESSDQVKRIKRVKFYQKNGALILDGFNYILPLPSAPDDLEMKILFFKINSNLSNEINSTEIQKIIRDIYVNVYACQVTDERLNRMFFKASPTFKLKHAGGSRV